MDDAALEVTHAEVEEAEVRIPELEETVRLEREAHTAKSEGLRERIDDAEERLARVRYPSTSSQTTSNNSSWRTDRTVTSD